MQLRKNLLTASLAAMLALGAVACGGGAEEPAGEPTDGVATEATEAETEAATDAATETEAATEEAS